MKLYKLVKHLNEYLNIREFEDISQNGLQVDSGNTEVKKVAIAVDACMETFKKIKQAQILIVHHGLFWNKSLLIKGTHRDKIAFLLKNNIALYAVHLPLDAHAELGNNAQLAKLLDMEVIGPFGKGIGCEAKFKKAVDREILTKKILGVVGATNHRLLDFGPKKIRKVAIVSGVGSSFLYEAIAKKVDMLITGEGNHVSYHIAKEEKLNVLYAGHYATETLGVKAVAKHIEEKFSIPYHFIDIPTGF
ncbi:Nif3-like dinuclear metal center hexameric protein [Candidatus Uabimicrobium sp. HlEnr_7]|uniref:Nif3-like dinuclear metal center hexameric protein n=1 Tax=Candidatus Uabimicrobium helgolandensis TaxID=3095367 RepID=UPI0035586524